MNAVFKLFVLSLFVVSATSCKSKIQTVSGFYDYETECVSSDGNGIQTVKAWGTGNTEKEAVLNARRRAVDDILFKGIRGGANYCDMRPIISNPNTRRNEEQYFYRFFAEGGAFEQYAGLPEENWIRQKLKINKKNKDNLAFEIVIEVDMMGLKDQMRRDNIIQ
ncbi:hypothetical protein N9W69_01395 [Flavobacteriaceae bacterium]|jgi:hypothetical protein|nr:hypothetical protein [Flavobacteriaceae bacterium]